MYKLNSRACRFALDCFASKTYYTRMVTQNGGTKPKEVYCTHHYNFTGFTMKIQWKSKKKTVL